MNSKQNTFYFTVQEIPQGRHEITLTTFGGDPNTPANLRTSIDYKQPSYISEIMHIERHKLRNTINVLKRDLRKGSHKN